jgi:hypothetical protein
MTEISKAVLLILTVSLVIACSSKSENTTDGGMKTDGPPAPCDEYSTPLGILGKADTLKILIEISDCGEWGGHRESLSLSRDSENKVIARLMVDSVQCDKIAVKDGFSHVDDRTRTVVLDKTLMLDLEDEKSVSRFIQRLIELYLKNEVHSNAGTGYDVINTDSTLNFSYWNSGDCRDTYYGGLRKQLLRKNDQ